MKWKLLKDGWKEGRWEMGGRMGIYSPEKGLSGLLTWKDVPKYLLTSNREEHREFTCSTLRRSAWRYCESLEPGLVTLLGARYGGEQEGDSRQRYLPTTCVIVLLL